MGELEPKSIGTLKRALGNTTQDREELFQEVRKNELMQEVEIGQQQEEKKKGTTFSTGTGSTSLGGESFEKNSHQEEKGQEKKEEKENKKRFEGEFGYEYQNFTPIGTLRFHGRFQNGVVVEGLSTPNTTYTAKVGKEKEFKGYNPLSIAAGFGITGEIEKEGSSIHGMEESSHHEFKTNEIMKETSPGKIKINSLFFMDAIMEMDSVSWRKNKVDFKPKLSASGELPLGSIKPSYELNAGIKVGNSLYFGAVRKDLSGGKVEIPMGIKATYEKGSFTYEIVADPKSKNYSAGIKYKF